MSPRLIVMTGTVDDTMRVLPNSERNAAEAGERWP